MEQVSKEFEYHNQCDNETETQIHNFVRKVIEDIMPLHSFNSCEELENISLLFPAGVYRIRVKYSNCSVILKYCNTSIAFLCSGIQGQWRKIA